MKTDYKTSQAKRQRATAYYAKNREARLAYAAEYRETNSKKVRAYFTTEEYRVQRNVRRQAWNVANRDRQKAVNEAHHLKRYHGLTVKQHAAMVTAQQGKCAICLEAPIGKKHCGKLHVDHDHETGAIRDLLCANCNRGLGLFADSSARLTRAAWYIERHRAAIRRTA